MIRGITLSWKNHLIKFIFLIEVTNGVGFFQMTLQKHALNNERNGFFENVALNFNI